jgi:LacI family transcriptional regulator
MARAGSNLMEVARRCSVSQSTVSRVLNNSKHGRFSVSDAVRSKILKVANELNYRPSIAARNLTVSKTNLVAVLGLAGLASDHVGPLEEAVGALTKALDQAGYEICVQFMSQRHRPFELPGLRVDGVVAVGPNSLDDLSVLERDNVPYVSLDGVVGLTGMQVISDDAGGARKALEHLVNLGHTRIAYLDNPEVGAAHISVATRRQAFLDASKQMGFEIPAVDVPKLPNGVSWDLYYEPFLQGMVLEGKATAVLAYSHYGALSLMRRAYDMGLVVPRDFSLICFNNEPMLALAIPSLTAVDLPSAAIGQVAAEMLLSEMNKSGSVEARCRKLDEELIVRESTATPRRAR